jgi:hypothetical protein
MLSDRLLRNLKLEQRSFDIHMNRSCEGYVIPFWTVMCTKDPDGNSTQVLN